MKETARRRGGKAHGNRTRENSTRRAADVFIAD